MSMSMHAIKIAPGIRLGFHRQRGYQRQLHATERWTRQHPLMKATAYRNDATQAAAEPFQGEDFYSLLGVAPTATSAQIRSAYRQLMKELHPDLAISSGDEVMDEATQLATLLNQIYETLMDEDGRAAYDLLAGFDVTATTVNPFLDTSFPRDQVFVDEVTCIGCGKCVRACPATFEIEASKYGRARVISQTDDVPEDIQIGIDMCPVSCIYWVSLPQLPLLESALAVMPRVEVFILQRSGNRAVGNVFEVAYKAFERRRALAAERAKAAAQSSGPSRVKVDWSFWTQRSDDADTAQDYDNDSSDTKSSRRVAGLAASAARAVRMWQSKGRAVRIRGLLSSESLESVDGVA